MKAIFALLAVVLLYACRVPQPRTIIYTILGPCEMLVSHDDLESWRRVQADGFSFCIPSTWHPDSQEVNTWYERQSSISWGTGIYHPKEIGSVITTLPTNTMPPAQLPGSEIHRFEEDIDGHTATIWRNFIGGRYYTGVRWDTQRIFISGEAEDSLTADLHLTIYRTVIFKK